MDYLPELIIKDERKEIKGLLSKLKEFNDEDKRHGVRECLISIIRIFKADIIYSEKESEKKAFHENIVRCEEIILELETLLKTEEGEQYEVENCSIIYDTIITQKVGDFYSIKGLGGVKDILNCLILKPIKQPRTLPANYKKNNGILLYGEPGTGKSMLGTALKEQCYGITTFYVGAAHISSKWRGGSENLIRTLFGIARNRTPAIIFLEEIDALTLARGDHDSCSTRGPLSQLLQELDGPNEGVYVIGATNKPGDMDGAVLRRFDRKVHVGLPDMQVRLGIFQHHFEAFFGEEQCKIWAKETEG